MNVILTLHVRVCVPLLNVCTLCGPHPSKKSGHELCIHDRTSRTRAFFFILDESVSDIIRYKLFEQIVLIGLILFI